MIFISGLIGKINFGGKQMYRIVQGDANNLKEREYVTGVSAGTGIQFSEFNSCIGVISLKNGLLIVR